jgi:hypothetical protein
MSSYPTSVTDPDISTVFFSLKPFSPIPFPDYNPYITGYKVYFFKSNSYNGHMKPEFPGKDGEGVTEIADGIKKLMENVDEDEWVEDVKSTRKEN